MTTMWNQLNLAEPPMCCTMVSVSKKTTECVSLMKGILQQCVSQLSDESHLSSEIFVLSNLIYKKNCQLRRDKAMQGLKQILRCLSRYSATNIYKVAVKLFNGFASFGSVLNESVYIPSKQTMEHFMVKLIGVTCLLSQTVNYAVHTFILLQQRLCRGHLTTINLVFMSAVSRVWAICKSQAFVYLSLYNRLLPVIHVLVPTEVSWIPDNDTLPSNLAQYVHTMTGIHLGKRQQEFDLTSMFERIEKESDVKSEKSEGHIHSDEDEGHIDSDEGEGHGSALIKNFDEKDTDFHNKNIEDLGVPIKKRRLLKSKEAAKRKDKISDETESLITDNIHVTDKSDCLSSVKKACSFDTLKSILMTFRSQMPLSFQFKTDWKISNITVKDLKKKSETSKKSGEKSIVQFRLMKKAKRSVQNLITKYSRLKDIAAEERDEAPSESMGKKSDELKSIQTGKTFGVIDRSSSTKLQTDVSDSENKVRRKQLKNVIKMLRETNQFEFEKECIQMGSVGGEKLRKDLQLVLKRLKKAENVEVRDIQKEAELLCEVTSLLVNAAALQKRENSDVVHQPEIVQDEAKRKPSKNKDGKLHTQIIKKQKEDNNNDIMSSEIVKTKGKRNPSKNKDGKLQSLLIENNKQENNSEVHPSKAVKNKKTGKPLKSESKLHTQLREKPKDRTPVIKTNKQKKNLRRRGKKNRNR